MSTNGRVKIDLMAPLFSINCFAAAGLALLIGFWLDLPRPYWAVLTVYIISQPLSGAVRSKALYRVCGTFLGASFVVFVMPVLVNEPWLLSLALALWVGICLGISLLDRTPRAYVVMLAGYTATLIGFPTVGHPDQIFDVAVSRVEEITLGILCATLTHSVFFPRQVGATLKLRLAEWLKQADQWALDLLSGRDLGKSASDRRQLATAANEIYMLSILLPFDASALSHMVAVVRATHQRLLQLIPVLSGVDDRLRALRAYPGGLDDGSSAVIAAVADWVAEGVDSDAATPLRDQLEARKSANFRGDWAALLRHNLLTRLQDLVSTLSEAHCYLKALQTPSRPLPSAVSDQLAGQSRRKLHRDVGLAILSGLSAFLTIMLVCALWIVTGWTDGGYAAALAGVFCALFAVLDDPAPSISTFGVFFGLSIPVAAFYQFAVLPGIDGLPLLLLFLAPTFLLGGALMVNRRTALPALSFMVGLSSSLALQESYSVDFADFVNSNTAIYVSLFIALVVTRTIRSLSVEASVHRLLRRIWKQLATVARSPGVSDSNEIVAEITDRIGLLVPKLGAAGLDSGTSGVDVLTDLRIGANLVLIQRYRAAGQPQEARALTDLLQQIGSHFANLSAHGKEPPPAQTLTALDACLVAAFQSTANPAAKGLGVDALVGLRRNLFPAAPAFSAEVSS